jgi:hypothetical protein
MPIDPNASNFWAYWALAGVDTAVISIAANSVVRISLMKIFLVLNE